MQRRASVPLHSRLASSCSGITDRRAPLAIYLMLIGLSLAGAMLDLRESMQ